MKSFMNHGMLFICSQRKKEGWSHPKYEFIDYLQIISAQIENDNQFEV